MTDRDDYDRFAQWLLDATEKKLLPERFDPYPLFEAWKAGTERLRPVIEETYIELVNLATNREAFASWILNGPKFAALREIASERVTVSETCEQGK